MGKLRLHGFQLIEHSLAGVEHLLPFVGQLNAARTAMKQTHTQALLKPRHRLADGR
nr:hypothetical protein [Pseudomonas sp. URMO17WK12:I11]